MTLQQEIEAVAVIVATTKPGSDERRRALSKLADDNSIAVGCVCRCCEADRAFCPRHGHIDRCPSAPGSY